MRYAHEVGKVRAAEQALMARLPEGTLMQRAAAGLAAVCCRLLPRVYGAHVVLLVGGGDNGGDALYAGARLARRGARVEAVLAGSKAHPQGLAALREAGGRVLPADRAEPAVRHADLVIDGLTGIGGTGALREPYAALARLTEDTDAIVVACDVPSGVDAGTGRVDGAAVRADVTVTFGTCKPGLLIDPGAARCGTVELIDIGLGADLPDPDVVAVWPEDLHIPLPSPESDKYRRGVVGIVAGSERYTGAAVLCVGGAVRGGAGMVRFASVPRPVELVRQRWPEAVTTIIERTPAALEKVGRVQAWVVGPGLGTDRGAEALVEAVLRTELPVLVDADGLTVLARRRDLLRRQAPTVLTPHAGELARLLGRDARREEIEARRLEHVRRAAAELSATVLLKGSTTLIAEQDRPVRVNPTGTPWLATAGTGDVLSGLIGALLAGGMTALEAATAGAYLHGLAGRLAASAAGSGARTGQAPIGAHDVVTALPDAFRTLS
ncbi:bifunctional ADP-dependent NAD(P)H-hydrate dehydratase/NAD(P)H-hydrate epimerase [Thermomonospora curvata]|uniref:Bifunctional NAD(P)H-hydrate repair enzyme n=1 Tax=Thermomonospora curvata (strain ATCC 19995 / DSM 43183 / JCM 3096 / KCTC 9072 / NBRC 15933 / NCIMB 10081 / Henssen B9) TaxID=471852 RepID=D1A325_THECD|nr:bifunctional ADP-dependent NAD(P)H-hydrate dehydratase/NAD(P)H-hydrate epimerase [Thermomonospora curvata]ACY99795.1 carbohydrate kinase, YjeF related protein [Thermomonospora curvata DSM 43183]